MEKLIEQFRSFLSNASAENFNSLIAVFIFAVFFILLFVGFIIALRNAKKARDEHKFYVFMQNEENRKWYYEQKQKEQQKKRDDEAMKIYELSKRLNVNKK